MPNKPKKRKGEDFDCSQRTTCRLGEDKKTKKNKRYNRSRGFSVLSSSPLMATHKILHRLRRSIPTTSLSRQYHLLANPNPNSTTLLNPLRLSLLSPRTANSLAGALRPFSSRSISTRADDDSEFAEAGGFDVDSVTEFSELVTDSKIVDAGLSNADADSILPVRELISLLDGFHEFTGLPW